MSALYNDSDPEICAWVEELIHRNLIAPGEIWCRDIQDIRPDEISKFTQFHAFCGVGVWSYALRNAGWRDDRPVWTVSCPCQPFSAAGQGAGFADERHLWPAWFHLAGQCRPGVVFGEQVASSDSAPWIDLVHDDLEALGYAFGPVVFPAAGVGAPHGRHRIFFVADAIGERLRGGGHGANGATPGGVQGADGERERVRPDVGASDRTLCSVANAPGFRFERLPAIGRSNTSEEDGRRLLKPQRDCATRGPVNGFWADAEWLPCSDGKARAAQRSIQPLVDGTSRGMGRGSHSSLAFNANSTAEARTMRLRGYGNAINAEAAEAFIRAYLETTNR